MKNPIRAMAHDVTQFAEDACTLMTSTADMAGEKVGDARKGLAAAVESGREFYDRVHDKTVDGIQSAGQAVHEHPYPVIGVALGVGALIGYLLTRRHDR